MEAKACPGESHYRSNTFHLWMYYPLNSYKSNGVTLDFSKDTDNLTRHMQFTKSAQYSPEVDMFKWDR